MDTEATIRARMKRNYRLNKWWLRLCYPAITSLLIRFNCPHQTIGVFLNPTTSNDERIRIIKFLWSKKINGAS